MKYFLILKRQGSPDIEWYKFNRKELIEFVKELPDKLEFIKIIEEKFEVGAIPVKIQLDGKELAAIVSERLRIKEPFIRKMSRI